jgi:hypothetical protein
MQEENNEQVEQETSETANDVTSELAKFKELAENYRIRAEKAEAKAKGKGETFDPDTIRKEAEAAARATLEQRDLDELEHSDDIKESIKQIAQLKGVSVRTAAKDPYIAHLVAQEEATRRMNEAADNGGKKGLKSSYDPSQPLNPNDFDLSTEEGRKSWEEAKAARRKS